MLFYTNLHHTPEYKGFSSQRASLLEVTLMRLVLKRHFRQGRRISIEEQREPQIVCQPSISSWSDDAADEGDDILPAIVLIKTRAHFKMKISRRIE